MSAIVCFDIRNFSTHVSHLSVTRKGASKKVFAAVEEIFGSLTKKLSLFLKRLVFQTRPMSSIRATALSRYSTAKAIVYRAYSWRHCWRPMWRKYLLSITAQRDRHGTTESLPSLDYGMGIHLGPVHKFNYQPVYQPGNKTVGVGLLGHAINMANRVQEATKDHTYRIICTKRVFTEGNRCRQLKGKTEV